MFKEIQKILLSSPKNMDDLIKKLSEYIKLNDQDIITMYFEYDGNKIDRIIMKYYFIVTNLYRTKMDYEVVLIHSDFDLEYLTSKEWESYPY